MIIEARLFYTLFMYLSFLVVKVHALLRRYPFNIDHWFKEIRQNRKFFYFSKSINFNDKKYQNFLADLFCHAPVTRSGFIFKIFISKLINLFSRCKRIYNRSRRDFRDVQLLFLSKTMSKSQLLLR